MQRQPEVNNMIAKALDHGINFFDNAWEYHKGASEERVGSAVKGKRDKAIVMTKVCTHGRKKDVAMRMLEESLTRLQTDHLDVWQVHEVVYYNDPEKCYASEGVLEVLTAAKEQGKVRFVGFTGHKNPSIHLEMLNGGYPFDTVQMPLNPFDYSYRSFQQEVLPVAVKRGMAVFGMKSMGGSGEMISSGALTPTEALSYAMSLPGVSTTISGMDSMAVLDQNLKIIQNFKPLTSRQIEELRTYGRQFEDGRYELFKSTVKYDGDLGREQHDYPPAAKLSRIKGRRSSNPFSPDELTWSLALVDLLKRVRHLVAKDLNWGTSKERRFSRTEYRPRFYKQPQSRMRHPS